MTSPPAPGQPNSLTDLVNAVYVETNRPDLVNETLQAVIGSLMKLHSMEFFYKDIAAARIRFDQSQWIQELDTTAFPRWRNLAYFRKFDPLYDPSQINPLVPPPTSWPLSDTVYNQALALKFLKVITPDDILDDYGIEKQDVCYQAGLTVLCKSSTSFQYGQVGYYQFPNLDPTGKLFSSWIATEHPYAVVYDAASAILQKTGRQDAARKYDAPETSTGGPGLATSAIDNLRISNIVATGY